MANPLGWRALPMGQHALVWQDVIFGVMIRGLVSAPPASSMWQFWQWSRQERVGLVAATTLHSRNGGVAEWRMQSTE